MKHFHKGLSSNYDSDNSRIFLTGNPYMSNTELGIVETTEILKLSKEMDKFEKFYFSMDQEFSGSNSVINHDYSLITSTDGDRMLICKFTN